MKEKFTRTNPLTTMTLSLLMAMTFLSACKKSESTIMESGKIEKPTEPNAVSNEKLVKYLSITLGVSKEEVIFDKKNNGFNVRGHKLSRTETEENYLAANVYRATYGD